MTLISITVPTATSQVKIQLQGIPLGILAIGPEDDPAPLLVYLQPITAPVGSPVVCEGEVLGNDVITLNGVTGLTYYLVVVFDPNTGATISEEYFFISGNNLDLDTAPTLSEGDLPNPVYTVLVDPPTTTTSTGVEGDIANDTTYFYVCVATNTWGRIALDFSF
jgi:hypothetical protein